MQGLLPGSVSKYCLQQSPVPVIVVRPGSKRLNNKKTRLQESGRSLYGSMLEKAQTAGGSHVFAKNIYPNMSIEASEQEAEAVAKAIGPPKRGILKGTYGGHLARVNNDVTSEDDEPEPAPRFSLPIGYLSTEAAPRADLAMASPSIAGLVEDYSEENRKHRARSKSPAPQIRHERADSEAAMSDEEDIRLLVANTVEQRRPSVRETTPWLANILRAPEPTPRRRAPSHGRSPSR
jgi:hypothetical protein